MKETFRDKLEVWLRQSISDEYTGAIADHIVEEVQEDLEVSADKEWNEDDLRLAIGRVLLEKLEMLF